MERFTLSDFEGSVESLITMLQELPPGSRLELGSEWRRSSFIDGDPEQVEFLELKTPEK